MPEVIFPGPEGRLEGRYHPHKGMRDAPIAIILHPHPQFGGTMNNRVVYNLHYTFHNMGFNVLRFNFRGVGRSQGEYDQGIGELSDAASALDYLQSMNPNAKHCWVAGFSFGAWIGMPLVNKLHEQKGITITHQEVEGAGHFFEDQHMDTLTGSVEEYVGRRLTENTR